MPKNVVNTPDKPIQPMQVGKINPQATKPIKISAPVTGTAMQGKLDKGKRKM